MNVLIIGGGLTGTYLALEMARQGWQVTVVEKRPANADKLQALVPEANVLCGDGDDPEMLERAGIRGTDVVVATTGDDEDNLVVCLLAKIEFQAPRTLARVNNPKNEWLFTSDMGVDLCVSQAHVMADLMRGEISPSR